MGCKYCRSAKIVKHGKANSKQRYLCKECGHKFIEGSDIPRMRTKSRTISTSIDLYFEGLSVHYNFVRPHQSLRGKTPAQASGINMKNDWHLLVKEATKAKALNAKRAKQIEVLAP